MTSIHVEWDSVSDGTLPGGSILGYTLYVRDIETGYTWNAYNGVELGLTSQTSFSVNSLTTGKRYAFSASAHQFNGEGVISSEYEFYSCLNPSS